MPSSPVGPCGGADAEADAGASCRLLRWEFVRWHSCHWAIELEVALHADNVRNADRRFLHLMGLCCALHALVACTV